MLRSIPTTLRASAPSSSSIFRQTLPAIRLLSQTTTTPSSAAATSAAAPSAESTPSAPSSSQTSKAATPQRRPYFVSRNFGNNFSVYHLRKRGGNLRQTVIKKIEGDARTLKGDLVADLALPEKEVAVNARTNHVTIKGFHEDRVKAWLAQRGF